MPLGYVMNSEIYERYWEAGQAWSPSEHPFYNFERDLIEKVGKRGETCLDYGCGDARRYGKILQEMGFNYHGFDISQTAVRQASILGVNVSLLNSDGTTSLPDESCDFAICFEVFEHLMEPQIALAEIFRILKSGGHLICSVPNAAYFARRIEFLGTGFLNPKGDPTIERSEPWRDPHIRFFSAKTLARFIASQGFTNISVSGSPFTLDFAAAHFRFLKPNSANRKRLGSVFNSLSWLGQMCPSWFGRRLLASSQKPVTGY